MLTSFVRESWIPVSPDALDRWHRRPGALERLTPPWESVRVVSRTGPVANGAQVEIEISPAPLVKLRWLSEHFDDHPGSGFSDRQVTGPFKSWTHVHRFLPSGEGGSLLRDEIRYCGPGVCAIGTGISEWLVRGKLEAGFRFRHRRTRDDLERHREFADAPLRIVVSGAGGLVGRNLVPFLTGGGHVVDRLVRKPSSPAQQSLGGGDIVWNLGSRTIDAAALEGVDAVVHLAGEGIADGRWTPDRKRAIRDSRVHGTRLLCETLASLSSKPKVLVAASAVGFYDPHGRNLTEASPAGEGFLAEVCREWEEATRPALEAGIRVVNLRIGVVLAAQGGALAKMLPPFKAGAGGVVGDGKQGMSWIALDDLIGAIHFAIQRDDLAGPVNATAPSPAVNREFTKTLGRVLGRPTIAPLPGFVVRTLFGEMGQALLLEGPTVLPSRLASAGFRFRHADLEQALRMELGIFGPEQASSDRPVGMLTTWTTKHEAVGTGA